MTRHLVDTSHDRSNARLLQFLKILRDQTPHESSRRLTSRLRLRANQRLRAYARIVRGRTV